MPLLFHTACVFVVQDASSVAAAAEGWKVKASLISSIWMRKTYDMCVEMP